MDRISRSRLFTISKSASSDAPRAERLVALAKSLDPHDVEMACRAVYSSEKVADVLKTGDRTAIAMLALAYELEVPCPATISAAAEGIAKAAAALDVHEMHALAKSLAAIIPPQALQKIARDEQIKSRPPLALKKKVLRDAKGRISHIVEAFETGDVVVKTIERDSSGKISALVQTLQPRREPVTP